MEANKEGPVSHSVLSGPSSPVVSPNTGEQAGTVSETEQRGPSASWQKPMKEESDRRAGGLPALACCFSLFLTHPEPEASLLSRDHFSAPQPQAGSQPLPPRLKGLSVWRGAWARGPSPNTSGSWRPWGSLHTCLSGPSGWPSPPVLPHQSPALTTPQLALHSLWAGLSHPPLLSL